MSDPLTYASDTLAINNVVLRCIIHFEKISSELASIIDMHLMMLSSLQQPQNVPHFLFVFELCVPLETIITQRHFSKFNFLFCSIRHITAQCCTLLEDKFIVWTSCWKNIEVPTRLFIFANNFFFFRRTVAEWNKAKLINGLWQFMFCYYFVSFLFTQTKISNFQHKLWIMLFGNVIPLLKLTKVHHTDPLFYIHFYVHQILFRDEWKWIF